MWFDMCILEGGPVILKIMCCCCPRFVFAKGLSASHTHLEHIILDIRSSTLYPV